MSLSSKIRGHFGHLVIGKKRAAEEKKFKEERRHKFGPLVLGDKPPVRANTPAPDSKPVSSGMSVTRMAEVLEKNPAFVASLVEQEFARERSAIRRGALQLFIQYAPRGYSDPAKAALVIARCERFLAAGEDPDQVAKLTKAHLARGAQAGNPDDAADALEQGVAPATDAPAGTLDDEGAPKA